MMIIMIIVVVVVVVVVVVAVVVVVIIVMIVTTVIDCMSGQLLLRLLPGARRALAQPSYQGVFYYCWLHFEDAS